MCRGRDRDALLRVEHDDVGVGADGERSLSRVEAEELRRVRAEELDHPVQRDAALAHAEVVDHLQPVLETGATVRDLAEVVDARVLLALEEVGAMVGRDRLQQIRAHRVPEHVLVRLRAGRRRVDVLRPFEVRLVEERLVDEEVLRARLAPDVPTLLARECDRLRRLRARHVDDVERSAGDAGELDGAVRRLALELGRTRQRMEVR
jgi:hypothetical protein